jgi:hypothetical protein
MKPAGALTIVIDAEYLAPMGYGVTWKATVREVLIGSLSNRLFYLELFDNDSGRRYAGRFQTQAERSVTLRLRRLPELPAWTEEDDKRDFDAKANYASDEDFDSQFRRDVMLSRLFIISFNDIDVIRSLMRSIFACGSRPRCL